ncbi:XRE family transcriptional regulator [Ferrigenium kumadai]|uniref:XRE family transcriptional regulator n=1 Tax=Ferrigenium kumadai TaxID=1682490 RepID=A0AAN1SZB4_9PROT|nr:XRE family transcriptional regulator [Ferrigenium kumadai]
MREARERLGLNVTDVAHQIKLAPRQIEALEADDYQRLPEMAFVRGFVRSYAKILHLDAESLLAVLPQPEAAAVQPILPSVEVPFPSPLSPQRQNLILLGAALLLAVVVVAFAVWHLTTPQEKTETAQVETPLALPADVQVIPASPVAEASTMASAVPAVSAPQPLPVAAQSSVPAAKTAVAPTATAKPVPQPDTSAKTGVLRLVFGEESWTEIRDRDGKLISSQINLPGSELRLDGRAPLSLVIGHAASAHLYYKGKEVDLKPYTNATSEVARLTLE